MKILTLIHSIFPTTSEINPSLEVEVWQSLFPEPFPQVLEATKACLQKTHFPPKPADIREQMYQVAVGENYIDAETAWNIARKFWRNLPSHRIEEFMDEWLKLPESIKSIYTPSDMVELAYHMTSEYINTYEKPRFMKAYERKREEKKKVAIASPMLNFIGYDGNFKKIWREDRGDSQDGQN